MKSASVTAGTVLLKRAEADTVARPQSRALSRELARAMAGPLQLQKRPVHRFSAGASLFHVGDSVDRLPYLESGNLHAVLHLQRGLGGQVVPTTFNEGELALLSHLFCDDVAAAALVAANEVSVRWLPRVEIENELLCNPALTVKLVRFLGQRLREVQTRERAWAERGVNERVRAALARMAKEAVPDAQNRILIAATHEQVAARCGVSRPKTSLALKRLEREGHIALGRSSIRVLDPAALVDA